MGGEEVNFTIRPLTPNIVYATVKSCAIKLGEHGEIKIFGYNDLDMCFLEEAGATWTTSASQMGSISGHWKAFQWVTNGLTDSEQQTFSCLLGLSQKKTLTQPKNVYSNKMLNPK